MGRGVCVWPGTTPLRESKAARICPDSCAARSQHVRRLVLQEAPFGTAHSEWLLPYAPVVVSSSTVPRYEVRTVLDLRDLGLLQCGPHPRLGLGRVEQRSPQGTPGKPAVVIG